MKNITKLKKICRMLTSYFTVCLIIDFDNSLDLKDSPADKGKATFEKLMGESIVICDVDEDFNYYFNNHNTINELWFCKNNKKLRTLSS